ncbi:hypothetical protein PACTADRAFT_43058 [Pachysolen tannophilus NRRL Y-2460]|uniref:FAD/NAD(P)-binding domain-containing protein n=1 Tax=Pachysolen tannophilus NRRL Y-2460 TaxID=669874 RepID=A0A1E4TTP9_PACTA|nr:hypothetical protein PACTADRAFT_43058 [Pachysolen tannophilus NRRL Y-2460]
MTIETDIKSIAIIGGGPAGLASLYELLHVLKDGRSIFDIRDTTEYKLKNELSFEEVVLFERNSSIGGLWARTEAGKKDNLETKLGLPCLKKENYDDPEKFLQKIDIPVGVNNATFEKPIETINDFFEDESNCRWSGSGIYEGLFTNVPDKYMKFSYSSDSDSDSAKTKNYPKLNNLSPFEQVTATLEEVVSDNHLEPHIRLNTSVELVVKRGDKWVVTLKNTINSSSICKWYTQEFDAIVIANGKSIPLIPFIPGLKNFYEKFSRKIDIRHSKTISNPANFVEKGKILFIGGNISAIDLIQYCFPRNLDPASIFVSRKNETNSTSSEWVNILGYSYGIKRKPEISKFNDNGDIIFSDGTIESNFDSIIFCTGYHMHYPFLDDKERNFLKRANDFYLHTFSPHDPTLALVGNLFTAFYFNRAEASAAAIAGVWSGFKKLPPKNEQIEWIKFKAPSKYPIWDVKEQFIKNLLEYAPNGRKNPLDIIDKQDDYIKEFNIAHQTLIKIFLDLKENLYSPKDIYI